MSPHLLNPILQQSVGFNLAQNTARQVASMHMYQGQYWSSNFLKGELLERSTLGLVNSGLLKTGGENWNILSPHRMGRGGIDSLLVKLDELGRPRDLMVVEAKFGSSKLGSTRDGRQMSETWVRPRLARTAMQYRQLADELRDNGFLFGSTGAGNSVAVPMQDGTIVYVTKYRGRLFVTGAKGRVNSLQLEKQARRMGAYVAGVGEGKISFRSRLIRLSVRDGKWVFGLDRLDPVTGVTTSTTVFEGRLPSNVHTLLKKVLASVISETGIPTEAVPCIVDEVDKNPALLSAVQKQAKTSWTIGFDKGMVSAAGSAVVMALLIEFGRSIFSSKELNYKQLARIGSASAGSAATGYYVGSQVHSRLLTTELGRRITSLLPVRNAAGSSIAGLSSMAGGIASSVAFALFGYAMGWFNEREAKITAIAGTVGAFGSLAFTTGALGAAMAWGTAGTGVAISTLSGAAATNAGLAALGGGTLAAGGGGVALGTTVLTAGAAAVGIAVCAAVSIAHSTLDKKRQRILALCRLRMAEDKINKTVAALQGSLFMPKSDF